MVNSTRRHVIQSSAAVFGSLSVAGCTGGGEGDEDESPTKSQTPTPSTTATPKPELEIGELAFAAEKPAGHGEYTEQPNAEYEVDEVIWLYLDINGVSAESSESGELTIDLQQDVTVTGPSDYYREEEFLYQREIPESALETFWVFNELTLPTSVAAGTYTVDIEVTDQNSQQSVTISREFSITKPTGQAPGSFGISDFAFAAREPTGYNDFVPQPNAAYPQGKRLWLYFNVPGIGYRREAGSKVIDHDVTYTIKDANGNVVAEDSHHLGDEYSSDTDLSEYWITIWQPTSSFETGRHSIEIVLTDNVTNNTDSMTQSFSIIDPIQQADGNFDVHNLLFAATEPDGYRDYNRQPDATYVAGDDIVYYWEVPGISFTWDDDIKRIHLTRSEEVKGPDGEVLFEDEGEVRGDIEADTDLSRYWNWDVLTTSSDLASGDYTLTLELTDELGGKSASESKVFTIE